MECRLHAWITSHSSSTTVTNHQPVKEVSHAVHRSGCFRYLRATGLWHDPVPGVRG